MALSKQTRIFRQEALDSLWRYYLRKLRHRSFVTGHSSDE